MPVYYSPGVIKYCEGCPVPFECQYMMPCCGKCYTDCDDEGWWTPDENHIDGKCGMGFIRDGAQGGAAPMTNVMVRS